MPTIIIEDGTGIANANSYVSVAELRVFADGRGELLSIDNDVVARLLIQASDWIQAQEAMGLLIGERAHDLQALAFPRKWSVYCESAYPLLDGNVVPINIKTTQSFLALSAARGLSLMPDFVSTDSIKREKVGPLETEYFQSSMVGPSLTAAESFFSYFLKSLQTGGSIRVDRA